MEPEVSLPCSQHSNRLTSRYGACLGLRIHFALDVQLATLCAVREMESGLREVPACPCASSDGLQIGLHEDLWGELRVQLTGELCR